MANEEARSVLPMRALILLILVIALAFASQDKGVLERDVQALTFHASSMSYRVRTALQAQMQCKGGCVEPLPTQAQCVNKGLDDQGRVNWDCTVEGVPNGHRITYSRVRCESWPNQGDPLVLAGSCVLDYKMAGPPPMEETPLKTFFEPVPPLPPLRHERQQPAPADHMPYVAIIVIVMVLSVATIACMCTEGCCRDRPLRAVAHVPPSPPSAPPFLETLDRMAPAEEEVPRRRTMRRRSAVYQAEEPPVPVYQAPPVVVAPVYQAPPPPVVIAQPPVVVTPPIVTQVPVFSAAPPRVVEHHYHATPPQREVSPPARAKATHTERVFATSEGHD